MENRKRFFLFFLFRVRNTAAINALGDCLRKRNFVVTQGHGRQGSPIRICIPWELGWWTMAVTEESSMLMESGCI